MSWRLILGLPLAGAVVMFLFLLMSDMISIDDFVPGTPNTSPEITLPEVPGEPEPTRPERLQPDELPKPPQPDTEVEITIDSPAVGNEGPGSFDGETTLDPGGLPDLDRNAQPLVRTNPTGFERCFDGGTDGSQRVRLRFDVAPDGRTANVEVVSSTDRCFERSAKRAVENWRYSPKMQSGEAVWRYNVETTIVFELAE